MARATPIGVLTRVMMTMASLMANHTHPGRPTTIMTNSQPFSTLPELAASKFGAGCTDKKSPLTSPVLQEIPTRISLLTSLNTIIDCPDDDDNTCNPNKKDMLHPTNLEGNAAILPPLPHLDFPADFDYQLELTTITTVCKWLEQQWSMMTKLPLLLSNSPMTNMAPSDHVTLVATQALNNFLFQYPRLIDCLDDDNRNHPQDEL